jgi:hypothetical protein
VPVVRRQIEELTRRFLLEGLREGRHISPVVLAGKIRDFLAGRPEHGPVMRVRAQNRKRKWDLEAQNRVFEELDLDLEVLFAEMTDLSKTLLRRHNFTEIAYHAQSRDLDIVSAELSNLLFVTRNTNDRFYGVFDNFRDLSKVDVELSTENVVDLSESTLILPAGALGTRKVNLSHMHEVPTWHVFVTAEGTVREARMATPFRNAFHDLVTAWRHDVTTDQPGPVSVEFTFPVSRVETQEVTISRVQFVPHSAKPMRALVLYSRDNVNYLKIPQGSEVNMTRSDQEYNLDTAQIRLQYLRVVLTKDEPDTENPDGTYLYSFGLKHLGLYTVGRAIQAEMVSQPLTPAKMTDPISRVSLRATTTTPIGTRVQWYIKAIDSDGEEVGGWRPISPSNATAPDFPTVLRFGNEDQVRLLLSGASATVWSTFRNASVYELAGSALPSGETAIDPVFGTAQLFRGLGAWSRNRRTERRVKRVRDSYVSFDTGDRQSLWATITENAVPTTRTNDQGNDATHLILSNTVDFDAGTMPIKPPPGVDPALDPTPRYAIHSARWYPSDIERTATLTVPELNVNWPAVLIPDKNIITERGTGEPVVTSEDGNTTYVRDTDYALWNAGSNRTSIVLIAGGVSQFPASGSATVKVTYNLDTDITNLVQKIEDNVVVLTDDLNATPDTAFEVTYRFVPKGDQTIIKNTINVTSKRGPDEGQTYLEGPDYSIDVQRGTITRIASGDIQPDGENTAAYVDFFYETPASLLETYTIWVFVDDREPKRILFNEQGLDYEAGEYFYIRTGGESVDLTRLSESPPLGFGWHQVVVRSRDPDTYPNTAIAKIAALKDKSGAPVFLSGGQYFSRVLASRVPMKQVEENYLLTNIVPANHGNFALTSAGEVLVNFNPGTTTDLYTYALRVEDGGTTTFAERDEQFELEYVRRITDATPITKIRVRAFLSRESSADGALTPKVDSYDVKVG